MTLLPVSIFAIVCFTIFIILRRKFPRVYAPRTILSILDPQYVSYSLRTDIIHVLFQATDRVTVNEVPNCLKDGSIG
jgi:hypothetical protein